LSRTLKIFFHDACFDGTAAAALFAAFYRDAIDSSVEVIPVGMIHRDGDPFEHVAFDGDDHACVDFRFSANAKLRWWFDHHATAFQPASLRDVFDAASEEQRKTWVFDLEAPSCTGLIARELAARWNWHPPAHFDEVITWADKIDAAAFPDAASAVALSEPAQQIAAWLAHGRSSEQTAGYIAQLSTRSIADIVLDRPIASAIVDIANGRADLTQELVQCARSQGAVVVFDRISAVGARGPGFLGYQLFPLARYTISATATLSAIKISVGVNPWASPTLASGDGQPAHIGRLCEALGGGGHALVGGITLRPDETRRARDTIRQLVAALA
jgi:hypothetical protein